MHRHFGKIHRFFLWLILVLMVPGLAAAQDQEEQYQFKLPTQIVPESPQTVPPSPSQNAETIPSNPMVAQPSSPPPARPYQAPQAQTPEEAGVPPPASMEQTQPILPDMFHGCWRGQVDTLDAIVRLPGAAKLGTWTPKTYRICYKRYGSGPYQLTLTETGVAPDNRIVSPTGTMRLLSSQGNTAMMLGSLHFDEYFPATVGFFGFGNQETFPVDETTKLRCIVAPDGMHAWATVNGTRDGAPWFRAYWHALFYQVPA
jgi:hypothetical protein